MRNRQDGLQAEFVPDDLSESFRIFLEREHHEAASLWSVVNHYRSAMALEPRENLLRLHCADMIKDLSVCIDQIAVHIGISHSPDHMAKLVNAATFRSMKANAERFTPSGGQKIWRNDARFFDSASSNKWDGKLSEAELAVYDERISNLLNAEERRWLERGSTAV